MLQNWVEIVGEKYGSLTAQIAAKESAAISFGKWRLQATL